MTTVSVFPLIILLLSMLCFLMAALNVKYSLMMALGLLFLSFSMSFAYLKC